MATINSTVQTEAKAEAAWVHALQQNTAFTVTPAIGDDQTVTRVAPAVFVECIEVEPANQFASEGYELVTMRITARTRKVDDKDKAVINALIGAVRAVVFSANLEGWLEEPGPNDISAYNPLFEADQVVWRNTSDADHHQRTVDVQSVISLIVSP